ncbi:MAG: DNA sulfur modification protein DndD [Cytophagales bacterium]|nr:DNA sulfur modification protein DndD [Cytophagales bacterium]
MIFREVDFNNFRIYHGHNSIYLTPEKEKNIIVISGLNGFGKTTFLMGLVWCFYGRQMDEVDEFYKKEIKEFGGYDKYIGNSLNHIASRNGDTKFSVSISIGEVNIPEIPCQEIKITRTFNVKTGAADEVEILIDGYESELVKGLGNEKLSAEEIFIRDFILPIEIAKFFFFDAEKIISLAEVSNSDQRRQLNYAYSEVLGIKKYEELKADLEETQIRLRQESASTKERKELEELQSKLNQNKIDIEAKEEDLKEIKGKKELEEYDVRQIEEKLIREGKQMTLEQLEELRKTSSELEAKIADLQEELKSSYDIIPFAIAGEKLLDVVKQLEIESDIKNAQLSQEKVQIATDKIINDLIAQPKPTNIVIDYRVEDYYKGVFKSLVKKHFFSDIPDVGEDYQALHDYSDTEKNELNVLVSNLKLSFKATFKRINSEYNQYRNELSAIKRTLKEAEANMEDPVITALRNKKDDLAKKIESKNRDISEIDQEIGGLQALNTQHEKRITEISKKIEVSKKNKKKDETAKRLISELESFIKNFKKQKKQSLENEILSGLNSLMHKQNFITKVDVDLIGDEVDIKLRNKKGIEIRKEGLSNGEKQMYASALLKGLVAESDIDFPVFIDSPMQKFDVDHAENIVRYFYPTISDQVVIFPLIKKEMTEEEYEILLPRVSNTYLIDNVTNEQSEFIEVEPKNLFEKFEEGRMSAV